MQPTSPQPPASAEPADAPSTPVPEATPCAPPASESAGATPDAQPDTATRRNTPAQSVEPLRRHGRNTRHLSTVLIYAVLAAAWIYGSDGLLALILPDPELLTQLSLLKGWLFVAVTSYALYRVLKSGDTPDRPKLLSAAGQRGLPGSATRPDTTPDVAPASEFRRVLFRSHVVCG